jgi:hypothetical protein
MAMRREREREQRERDRGRSVVFVMGWWLLLLLLLFFVAREAHHHFWCFVFGLLSLFTGGLACVQDHAFPQLP